MEELGRLDVDGSVEENRFMGRKWEGMGGRQIGWMIEDLARLNVG